MRFPLLLVLLLVPVIGNVTWAQVPSPPTPAPAPRSLDATALNAALRQSRAAFDRGDVNSAVAIVSAYLQEADPPASVLNWYGFLLLQQQKYDEAIVQFEKVFAVGEETYDTYLNYGNALLTKPNPTPKEIRRTVVLFKVAARLRPDSATVQSSLGYANYQAGYYDKAVEAYAKATQIDPNNAKNWSFLGYSRLRAGDATATEALRKAVELTPDDASAWRGLGQSELLAKNNKAAIQAFEKSDKLQPGVSETLLPLALLYRDTKQYGLAIKRFDELAASYEAAGKTTDALDIRLREASVLVSARRRPEAIAIYERVLNADANNAEALAGLGVALYDEKRYTDAVGRLRSAALLVSDNPKIWASLGAAQDAAGDDRAAFAWRKAVTLDPKNAAYRRSLTASLRRTKSFSSLIPVLQEEIKRSPQDATLYRDLGEAHYLQAQVAKTAADKQKHLAAALKALQTATAKKPDYADAWNDLGAVQEKRGELPQALASYRKAASLAPKNERIQANLARFTSTGNSAGSKVP